MTQTNPSRIVCLFSSSNEIITRRNYFLSPYQLSFYLSANNPVTFCWMGRKYRIHSSLQWDREDQEEKSGRGDWLLRKRKKVMKLEVWMYPSPENIFYVITITANIPFALIKCHIILHCFSHITSLKSHNNSVRYIYIFLIFIWLLLVLVAARGTFLEACGTFRCGTRASL